MAKTVNRKGGKKVPDPDCCGYKCVNTLVQRAIGKVLTKARARDKSRKWISRLTKYEIKARNATQHKKHRVKRIEQQKAYHVANKSTRNKRNSEYAKSNREKINRRRKERRVADEDYLVETRTRDRLNAYLKHPTGNIKKTNGTFTLVGCKPRELRLHLCRQLRPGEELMSHVIDHIFPFAMYTADQMNRVAHFSNVQPLTAYENSEKRDQLPTKSMAAKVEEWAWPDGVAVEDLPDSYCGWSTPLRL